MNLHSLVAPYVGAVNPMTVVTVRQSAGYTTNADGTRVPAYATPGGFIGSIAAGVLTVAAVSGGKILPGQTISATGVAANTMIVRQLTGADGGVGTYQTSQVQDVASKAFTTAMTLQAQLQPMTLRDLMQLSGIAMNGEKRAIYLNGDLDGVIRVQVKGGDLLTTPDGSVYLVVQNLEGWAPTSGWTKCAVVLQNGQ